MCALHSVQKKVHRWAPPFITSRARAEIDDFAGEVPGIFHFGPPTQHFGTLDLSSSVLAWAKMVTNILSNQLSSNISMFVFS